jgi:hypothetical protein
MKDPLPGWNAHVRKFAAKHHLRLRLSEDGEVRVLLGPRKTENHASINSSTTGWVWAVYFTAPSPNRVCEDVKHLSPAIHPLDGEGYFLVYEKDLLKACALNRWIKPRYKKVVGQKARESAQFGAFVQSLDGE